MTDVKNILLKFRYLKSELERSENIVSDAQIEFFQRTGRIQKDLNVFDGAFDDKFSTSNKNCEADNSHEVPEEDDEDDTIDEKDEKPSWAKKLFRKIATITHPDKIPENLSDDVKDQFLNYYKTAVESYESESFLDLLDIGNSLGVDLQKLEKIDLCEMKLEIRSMEKDISDLQSSFYWIWWHSDDGQKSELIREFVKESGWETSRSQSKKSRDGHPGQSVSWLRKNKY
tara:strand:- start:7043 stop:7729 length:687 start_codon:yes stop_codon:yes gene_type:complete